MYKRSKIHLHVIEYWYESCREASASADSEGLDQTVNRTG